MTPHVDAAKAVQVAWDERRMLAAERGMKRKRLQRRVALGIASATAFVLLGVWFAPKPDVTVAPFNGHAGVRVLPQTEGVEVAQLTEGGAWFDVKPNPHRTFRVEAGDVTVEVLGTRFAVEKTEHNVHVLVDHGRVRVKWKGGERILTNGDEGTFRLGEPEPAALEWSGPEATEHVATRLRQAQPERPRPAAPLDSARGALPPEPTVDEAEDLLHVADVARQTGHPAQAVDPLEQLVTKFPTDGRAPLAAFTLGRIQLDQLAQPKAAAASFAKARALDPNGPLAEDALARQVVATALGGDKDAAKLLATDYVTRYPNGRSLKAVKHHGGLE